MFCEHCGQKNLKTGRFCQFCGKEMRQINTVPAPANNVVHTAAPKKSSNVFLPIILVLLIIGGAYFGYTKYQENQQAKANAPESILDIAATPKPTPKSTPQNDTKSTPASEAPSTSVSEPSSITTAIAPAAATPAVTDNNSNAVINSIKAKREWWSVPGFADGNLYIWNPNPTEGESVNWEGGVIRHDELTGEKSNAPVCYVHGYGKATWYINGKFEQSDEGNHYGGKRHGEIIQRFADGRVVKTFWEHGVKK